MTLITVKLGLFRGIRKLGSFQYYGLDIKLRNLETSKNPETSCTFNCHSLVPENLPWWDFTHLRQAVACDGCQRSFTILWPWIIVTTFISFWLHKMKNFSQLCETDFLLFVCRSSKEEKFPYFIWLWTCFQIPSVMFSNSIGNNVLQLRPKVESYLRIFQQWWKWDTRSPFLRSVLHLFGTRTIDVLLV